MNCILNISFNLISCSYGKPVDIWAIGCLICEMTSGRPVYEGKSDLDQLQKIKSSLGREAELQLDEMQRSNKQPYIKVMNKNYSLFSIMSNYYVIILFRY